MESPSTSERSRWAFWILACVLSPRDLEVVMGDLAEEDAIRSSAIRGPHPSRWYWGQVIRSIPPLLWASIREGGYVATLVTAVGACLVQAMVELGGKFLTLTLVGADSGSAAVLSWIVGLPSLVFVSYLAARIRPGAATVLTAIVVIAVVVQLMLRAHDLPLWKQIAALLIGPTAAFAGGVISLRRQTPVNLD